jgi:serine/threonine protein kinase
MDRLSGTGSLDREACDPLTRVLRQLCQCRCVQLQDWRIGYSTDPARTWLRFSREAESIPVQGWKLHISANKLSAEAVLRRVFPLLIDEAASFKVASSLRQLIRLNQGEGGICQVGKFITIYPRDDEEAVRLAVKLDAATCGLSGPRIPSDRALRADSLVHYRYGSFRFRSYIQAPSGSIEAALQTPDNREVPDRRKPRYEAPEWATDPFVRAGIAAALPALDRIVGERYLIVSTVFASIDHCIYLGADLEKGNLCIIKGPGYAWQHNFADRSMHQRLFHEADVLSQLAPNPHIPTLLDVVEQNGDLFLIMEDIEGEDLTMRVSQTLHQGQYVPLPQVIKWGIELAEILETIHAKGFVFADLKPSNVMVDRDDDLYLIDFELAHVQDCDEVPGAGRGTRGYMSPQQRDGLPLTISDDIYSFGALLYFLVTGADPAYVPDHARLLERPLEWLRPGEADFLKAIIVRCLQEEAQARYRSMGEIKTALETALVALEAAHASVSLKMIVHEGLSSYQEDTQRRLHYRERSRELMETICSMARPSPGARGLAWVSTHFLTYGLLSRDINTGNAGVLLALADLVAAHNAACGRETLQAAAHWLCHTPPIGKKPLPGLYVGEAGVGAALLRVGQVLYNEQFITAALERGRTIASLPHVSPDLFNGTAGRLRFHLLLWDETEDQEQLQAALACGDHLLATAIEVSNHEVLWLTPQGYGDLSGVAQPGYAHGVAGIADALLDLYEVTGDERLASLITRAAFWIQRQAIPTMQCKRGLSWPRVTGGSAHPSYWCHGGAGIGRFFLHLARHNLVPDAEETATRAAYTVAHMTRWTGPTQCHGLAGNCEFLLDMYQATGEQGFLTDAFLFGRLLETFARKQDGYTVFSSDSPTTFTPDYMVGYGGIAMCLLRLGAPERLPHQLSRAGFRVHTTMEKEARLAGD